MFKPTKVKEITTNYNGTPSAIADNIKYKILF